MNVRRYEHLRYRVQSETHPEKEHLVDLLEFKCDCENFRFVRSQESPPSACKHIERATLAFGKEMLALIRARVRPYDGP